MRKTYLIKALVFLVITWALIVLGRYCRRIPQGNTVTKVIGPAGGIVVFSDGKAKFIIPEGAVESEITFNVTKTDDDMGQVGSIYEVSIPEMEEITFLKPVVVEISYHPGSLPEGVDERNLKLGLLGPFCSWYALPTSSVDINNHKVSAGTSHFSGIGILPTKPSSGNPPKLAFPLPNRVPWGGAENSVVVNSVFDHSMTRPYSSNDTVKAFNGEEGTVRVGSPQYKNLYGYKKPDGTIFFSNHEIEYSGADTLFYDGHPGYDFRTIDQGSNGHIPVLAAADGRVSTVDPLWGLVKIEHPGNYYTLYYHLLPGSIKVQRGQQVSKLETLGIAGGTAPSITNPRVPDPYRFGVHLHFEVRDGDNRPIDPYELRLWGIASGGQGTLKWSFPTGDDVYSSPAIGSDGTIYVGSKDNKLYAINPDGTLKWSFNTGGWVWSSPAIGSDGTIYVGSYDNKLYAINPDGTLKWSFTTGSSVSSSPAIGSDGTIYVGSCDYKLYAIYGSGTLANTPWPKFHHDLKNTGRVGGP
jgi:outer membrane protein assembly factor BamB